MQLYSESTGSGGKIFVSLRICVLNRHPCREKVHLRSTALFRWAFLHMSEMLSSWNSTQSQRLQLPERFSLEVFVPPPFGFTWCTVVAVAHETALFCHPQPLQLDSLHQMFQLFAASMEEIVNVYETGKLELVSDLGSIPLSCL